MTKLQKLYQIRSLINELIKQQEDRKYNEQNCYEQRKANNGCTAAKSCKNNIVPFHTMCSFHLKKQAEASNRRDRKRRYNANHS